MGGLFLFLEQKLASKVIKTGHFAYSAFQWRANPPPPQPLATLLLLAVRIDILPFNSSSVALGSFFTDLRKGKGKMPILAAKNRPCECSFRYILVKTVAKEKPAGSRPFLKIL